ncbi:FAD-dependent oxidoreductase [Angelakisella massiliensis]|uniref:FAD-dependent oxidoreductase n=1 Tax=Angelakisella massiliensis TaxID=1871018 RepID=UPI0008F8CAB3|nr:FAD-dependent oxidoreductase [Angelakisella massiliensis]
MKNFEHINAGSFAEATKELKSAGYAQPIAGGTDLVGTLKQGILPKFPDLVVNLKTIPDGAYIRDEGDQVSIGALTTLACVESDAAFAGELKAVAEAAHSVATPIIRNSATIGGNLCQDVRCWYYRYPDSVGGRLMCARKGGDQCYAVQGRNQYHSIMGGMKTGKNSCSSQCPAGTDIPGYMQKIREDNWDAAAEIIMRVNPMPMLTSRVCPHGCQTVCNQCEHGDSVSIHSVERALGDYILAHADKFYKAPATATGKKVSIVGGGPAGLTAAFYLRKAGHDVTIYEKMEEAGGVMMYGIPEYRLPKHYVRDLVKALTGMGIVIKANTEVGKDITLEEIKNASDTVLLDTGAWKQPILGIDGENLTQFGLNFLVEVKKFMSKQIGKEVLVCGGGNVAMDVALTAVRLGAQKVKLVCLEQREEMPASAEEIARAEEEGVEIFNGWGLKRVLSADGGKITGLESMKCVSVFDENGRFSPKYGDETRVFESDCIILATGQKVDTDFLGDKYKEQLKSPRGLIEVGEDRNTRAPGIYAGGDAAYGPSVAIKAIRDGGIAARSMSRYMGFPLEAPVAEHGFLKFDTEKVLVTKGAVEKDTPVGERSLSKEDSTSLTMEEAKAEAGRCMNCGCYSVNASDMANVMVALDAGIKTTGHQFKASEFFSVMHSVDLLEPGELVTEITIPKLPGYRTGYLKMRLRESIDFAVTALAYAYKEENGVIVDAKLAAGGIAPVPVRLTAAENVLIGQKKSLDLAEKAFAAAMKDASPMKENAYKLQEVKAQLIRSLEL